MPRDAVTPGELYRTLLAEFTRRRPPTCSRCRVTVPHPVARAGEASANWRLDPAPPCAHGCHSLIADIAADLAARYDVKPWVVTSEEKA